VWASVCSVVVCVRVRACVCVCVYWLAWEGGWAGVFADLVCMCLLVVCVSECG